MLRKKVSKEYLNILWKGRIQEIENISEYYYYTDGFLESQENP